MQCCVFLGKEYIAARTREKQYFTALTHDLLCIQLPDPTTSLCFADESNVPFVMRTPENMFDLDSVEDPDRPESMIEHLAFEYNPHWDIPCHKVFTEVKDYHLTDDYIHPNTSTILVEAVMDLSLRATVWFIDYRIKRRSGLPDS